MRSILVAVDGSETSLRVVEQVIEDMGHFKEPVQVHLLNVQPTLGGVNVKLFIGKDELAAYYQEQGAAALQAARDRLQAAGIAHLHHIGVGDPAQVVVDYAKNKHCGRIYMGSRGLGSMKGMILGSVATKVIHLGTVPIVLVK
jgi:nucleotide-binding universal stress UspA family protein